MDQEEETISEHEDGLSKIQKERRKKNKNEWRMLTCYSKSYKRPHLRIAGVQERVKLEQRV